MSDLDMPTSEMVARLRTSSRRDDQYTATRLEQQQAEIERLRANVHLAYYEGWDDAKHTFHIDVDVAWDRSEAKAALEGVRNE